MKRSNKKKYFLFYVLLIGVLVLSGGVYYSLLILKIDERLSPQQEVSAGELSSNLYPVLLTPFTQYSSTVYLFDNAGEEREREIPVLSGNAIINGEEATGHFQKKLARDLTYNLKTSIFISLREQNNFIEVIPVSGRAVNGLFDYQIDTTKFVNGDYILRIVLKDLDTGESGSLDEYIIIDNENTPSSLQQDKSCKCKKAEIDTRQLYHNTQIVQGMSAGPFFTPVIIKDPATGAISQGVIMGTGFSTWFDIDGDASQCKEGQGVISSEFYGSEITHLKSGFPNHVVSPDGRYGVKIRPPGDMKDYADDNYHIPSGGRERTGLKAHLRRNIVMTDFAQTTTTFSSYPDGYFRADKFLSEVENSHPDADGIKRKCRCRLEHRFGFTSQFASIPNAGIIDQECEEDVPVTCGDGNVDLGEECDDGNLDPTDGCSMACKLTICGDGIIQSPNGKNQKEECEKPFEACINKVDGGFGTCTIDCRCPGPLKKLGPGKPIF